MHDLEGMKDVERRRVDANPTGNNGGVESHHSTDEFRTASDDLNPRFLEPVKALRGNERPSRETRCDDEADYALDSTRSPIFPHSTNATVEMNPEGKLDSAGDSHVSMKDANDCRPFFVSSLNGQLRTPDCNFADVGIGHMDESSLQTECNNLIVSELTRVEK